MRHWLLLHWVAGALFMAAALLLLTPLLLGGWGLVLVLIYLHAPAYMLHQVEEHTGDRFRRFINGRLFGGADALTGTGVLWINLPGVWGINLLALYAAATLGLGFGLAAPYLMLVNAVVHIATTRMVPGYNPGLWTAVTLFVPLSLCTLWLVPASAMQHLIGLGIGIAVHATIAIGTKRRAARLAGPATGALGAMAGR